MIQSVPGFRAAQAIKRLRGKVAFRISLILKVFCCAKLGSPESMASPGIPRVGEGTADGDALGWLLRVYCLGRQTQGR
jgi:hypothetical protein